MQTLLTLANHAGTVAGEVPIAAAVLDAKGDIIASAHNEVESRRDATAHAELLVIKAACEKLGQKYLEGCTLVVTLEPCAMCAQAASHVKLAKIIYGAHDPKSGGVEHGARVFNHPTCHHVPEIIGGVMEAECGALLTGFFKGKRG